MKLTSHEKKILSLIKSNPDIVTDPKARGKLAKKHGLSEKTLRNRIGDLKKYGYIIKDEISFMTNSSSSSSIHSDEINLLDYINLIW